MEGLAGFCMPGLLLFPVISPMPEFYIRIKILGLIL